MKGFSIARRLTIFLAAFVGVTLATVVAFSYLLQSLSSSASNLANHAREKSQAAFELVDNVVEVQSFTQQLLSSNDPDAMEALLKENETLEKQAQVKVQELAAGDSEVGNALAALVKTNQQVTGLLLHARNIEARQMFLEKSNPVFESLLGSIKKFQDLTARNMEAEEARQTARASSIQMGIFVLAGVSVVLLAGFGLALGRSITRALRRVVEMVKDIAEGEGDLTKRLEIDTGGEIGELASWFNIFMKKLEGIVSQVAINTHRLASATEEISATATQQVRGTQSQGDETEQVASAMRQIASSVQQVSQDSNKAAVASQKAAEAARHGGEIVKQTLERMQTMAGSVGETAAKMQELGKSSKEIQQIVSVIDDIADQTNLLALNAAIEAARAGEQGRGFAVVADEVRKLAERTGAATKEIATMIRGIQQEMNAAVEAMQAGTGEAERGLESTTAAGSSLREIISMSQQVSEVISLIDQAASRQLSSTEEISSRVGQIAMITRETALGAHESSKAVEELTHLALNLENLVGQFKISGGNGHRDLAAN